MDPSSPEDVARFVTEAAGQAPSIYDTAPWWFGTGDHEISIRADLERRLAVRDPAGRELMLSCGAAVFTARLALRYLGRQPQVHVLPDGSSLVARIGWTDDVNPPSDFERALFDQIALRKSPLGDFGRRPLPPEVMSGLIADASHEQCGLRPMTDDDHRAALIAALAAATYAVRLDSGRTAESGNASQVDPASARILAVLTTSADQSANWIAAGQAMQRVLLVAAKHNVQVAVHSTAVEFASLRGFIRAELTDGDYPQVVLSFGVVS